MPLEPKQTLIAPSASEVFLSKTGDNGVAVSSEGSTVVMAPTGKNDGTWGNVLPGGAVYDCP